MANIRYIFIVLVTCFVGYVALFLFAGSESFCKLSKSAADLTPCYKFHVKDQSADVLLVGDSSLLYGVRPDVVAQVSGRTAYNFGIVGPVFAFDPQAVIDHYLAKNRRPRAIIVYLSPWDIVEPGHIHDPVWFPVGLQTLQHGKFGDYARLFRARPSALVELPQVVAASTGFSQGRNARLRTDMEAAGGHFDFAALAHASGKDALVCAAKPASVRVPVVAETRKALAALKAHYGRLGLPVYFYVAPFAACGVNAGAVQQAYRGLSDNVPAPLADGLFMPEQGSELHVHVNKAGSEAVSRLLGQFILDRGIAAKP